MELDAIQARLCFPALNWIKPGFLLATYAGFGRQASFASFAVIHSLMLSAVAGRTVHALLRHPAFKVLLDYAGSHLLVAINTGTLRRCCRGYAGSTKRQFLCIQYYS